MEVLAAMMLVGNTRSFDPQAPSDRRFESAQHLPSESVSGRTELLSTARDTLTTPNPKDPNPKHVNGCKRCCAVSGAAKHGVGDPARPGRASVTRRFGRTSLLP